MRTFLAVTAAAMVMTACLTQAQVGSVRETKAMVCLAYFACAGTTYNWIGAAQDDNWSTITNWSPNGYPGQSAPDDEAIINAASYDNPVILGGDYNGGEILLAATSTPALIGLGEGVTVTAGSDGATAFYVTATGDSLLTGAVGESNDEAETFVLHTGILRGSWTVDVIVLNHGHVATAPDYTGHTNRGDDPGDVHLTCRPKGGPGYWSVSGGDSNPHSTLVVDAALALSGTSFVDPDGDSDGLLITNGNR